MQLATLYRATGTCSVLGGLEEQCIEVPLAEEAAPTAKSSTLRPLAVQGCAELPASQAVLQELERCRMRLEDNWSAGATCAVKAAET
eukprot:CAMPEP_0115100176 /NCGR_PEP_ID=MMETSP0227-20121206/32376_1 /TAXON_ID=89957 /ORGANISM="Polarella glacialis, Strain CCMP 1383" /LENGTH=86 /DNA_ID=CAMNT_0002495477 /DNA_START=173 /DNA_END=429 /DNA_ORIENTATION=+